MSQIMCQHIGMCGRDRHSGVALSYAYGRSVTTSKGTAMKEVAESNECVKIITNHGTICRNSKELKQDIQKTYYGAIHCIDTTSISRVPS